jgi:hypothetical protein
MLNETNNFRNMGNKNDGDGVRCTEMEVRRMICLLRRYARIEAVDKLSYLLTVLIVSLVVVAFGISAVYFLSLAFLLELSALVGSEAMAALIVGLGLIVMMLLVIVFRKSLIRDSVIRVLWKKGGDEYA